MKIVWLIGSFCFISLLLSCNKSYKLKTEYTVDKDSLEILSTSGSRFISGVYPHLTTYAHNRVNGKYGYGNECGIGAIVPWGDKLYMINYAAHCPKGSEHNLYIIDKDKNMQIYPGSIGGTPAARMIHAESNQLLLGHYLIDRSGNIRTIPIEKMPGRITAIARHLIDPVNKVYYYDMEGMLYETDVNTLEVKKLFNNPLPGWHGKGGYTAQGKLVLSNNGESDWDGFDSSDEWKVPVEGQKGPEKYGVLAEYDGENFSIVERKQFTDVTTKNGINAVPNDNSPLWSWSIGWDKKSLRLKVLENNKWKTFLLPKAAFNNDPSHGWFTEWPRIREIGNNEIMMDMHGMFFDFPSTFSHDNTAGIRPIASHLRYIPDFCSWNGQIVLATDEVSIQGNPLSGQPQSNLWFGQKSDFYNWGPTNGYGAIWLKDSVLSNNVSEPYLFAGYKNKVAHVINHGKNTIEFVIQIDKKGNNQWCDFKTLRIEGNEYKMFIFPNDLEGEWIRLRTLTDCNASFILHYTTDNYIDGKKFEKEFSGLAEINTKKQIINSKLYSNRDNYNLSCFAKVVENNKVIESNDFEFCKFTFDFKKGVSDSLATVALNVNNKIWSVDEASVILHTKSGNLRLPKGNPAFDNYRDSRCIREVESERELANIHGTFYELPLKYVGQEPLFKMMRPVSSHNYIIDDYNTWNGLLVFSGIYRNTRNKNIFMNSDKTVSLWLGSIDDLWKLGKPVGIGGPWKNTNVKADVISDPYLMTGYDKKTLRIKSDKNVKVTLQLSVSHYLDETVVYKVFDVEADKEFEYKFPDGFSAHWAYLTTDKDCKITAQFIYE